MYANASILIPCTSCGGLMDRAEAWQGGRCESCALRLDPCACRRCKGRGTEYRPAIDRVGQVIRELAVCRDCGGEG